MSTDSTELRAAVAGEDAAIYAYGVLGPYLSGTALAQAQAAVSAHRDARDAAAATMSAPPAAEALYALPFPVTGTASALALAITVEERCAALWRAVTASADGAARQLPLDTLTATAVRAAVFRRLAGGFPGTVTYPGL